MRAVWIAQELLSSFGTVIGEVALVPGQAAVFKVTVDGEVIFDRQEEGRFPELKELKGVVKAAIASDM
ncbi:hypothetical protein BZG36_05701 [Bifiguratus adelaidae]|uniref:Selenoprotein W-related protein n=1 Tax=Bifiguratus adelaidae TaxID=1938954 RepID=A0A261XSN7_9FUNG|nr:hypothetical protein BZG36_05701 [Bifiguratus adelaidae]